MRTANSLRFSIVMAASILIFAAGNPKAAPNGADAAADKDARALSKVS